MSRQVFLQPDYLLTLVVKPKDWTPQQIDARPPKLDVISEHCVASFAEAMDDLWRCNRHALEYGLDVWAVVTSTACDL